MPQMTVTDEATRIPASGGVLVLQNVDDTNDIYFGSSADVTVEDGMKLAKDGGSFEFARSGFGAVFVVAASDSDLRWMTY